MHVVRSLLPQFFASQGARILDEAPPAGFDLLLERDGRRVAATVRDAPVSGADAVELRLAALAHGVVPLVVPLGGVTGEASRWFDRFAIETLDTSAVHAFEARVEAEEAALAEERLWALEHATPPSLPPEFPIEIPLASAALPPAEASTPPLPLVRIADPYVVSDLLVLRRSETIDRVRARLEAASEALLAVFGPEHGPAIAPPAPVPVAPPALELYGLAGLWALAASERLHGEALAVAAAAEALASLPWPDPSAPEQPVVAPVGEDVVLPGDLVLADLPFPADPPGLTEEIEPPAEPPLAELPSALPWAVEPAASASAEPEPAVAADLPWLQTEPPAAPEPEEPHLPWNTEAPSPFQLLAESRDAYAAGRALGRFVAAAGPDPAVLRADPAVWKTRDRLDGVRARLNRQNVALSVEGIESPWLQGIATPPADE